MVLRDDRLDAHPVSVCSKAVFSSAPDSAPPDSGGTVATLLNTVAFCFYLVIIVPSLPN